MSGDTDVALRDALIACGLHRAEQDDDPQCTLSLLEGMSLGSVLELLAQPTFRQELEVFGVSAPQAWQLKSKLAPTTSSTQQLSTTSALSSSSTTTAVPALHTAKKQKKKSVVSDLHVVLEKDGRYALTASGKKELTEAAPALKVKTFFKIYADALAPTVQDFLQLGFIVFGWSALRAVAKKFKLHRIGLLADFMRARELEELYLSGLQEFLSVDGVDRFLTLAADNVRRQYQYSTTSPKVIVDATKNAFLANIGTHYGNVVKMAAEKKVKLDVIEPVLRTFKPSKSLPEQTLAFVKIHLTDKAGSAVVHKLMHEHVFPQVAMLLGVKQPDGEKAATFGGATVVLNSGSPWVRYVVAGDGGALAETVGRRTLLHLPPIVDCVGVAIVADELLARALATPQQLLIPQPHSLTYSVSMQALAPKKSSLCGTRLQAEEIAHEKDVDAQRAAKWWTQESDDEGAEEDNDAANAQTSAAVLNAAFDAASLFDAATIVAEKEAAKKRKAPQP